MQSNKESNQKLIERFPFLMPRNRWTGEVPEDYDYSYTELDLLALRDVLKEAVNDQYDYIDWWLYEAADDFEIWEADCTMKYCLKEPEALYDFITGTLKPVPVSSGESTSQQE